MYWLEQPHQCQPLNSTLTGEYWPVFIHGKKIHSSLWDTLYEEIYRERMAMHWEKNDWMKQEHSMMVNLEACEGTMQHLKISHYHWVAKHTEGVFGVSKWLVIWQECDTSDCPKCSEFEVARHVWRYPANEANTICTAGIAHLSSWMETTQTAPELQAVIIIQLTQWANNQPLTPIPMGLAGLQEAIQFQDAIGWDNFFKGYITKERKQIQHMYYKWCR